MSLYFLLLIFKDRDFIGRIVMSLRFRHTKNKKRTKKKNIFGYSNPKVGFIFSSKQRLFQK